MSNHLKKLAAFAALQLAIALVVMLVADRPVKPSPPGVGMEARLYESLRQQLYPRWLRDANYLASAAKQPTPEPGLDKALRIYQWTNDGYLASINDKDWLLRTAPKRRLIMLGGSSAAFGVDSQILAERYDVTPINLGLHAMLRANYQLRHVQVYVSAGDVVLIGFEYQTLLDGAPESTPSLRHEFLKAMPAMRQYFIDEPSAAGEIGWKGYGDRLALAGFASHARGAADGFCDRLARLPRQWQAHGWKSQAELQREYDAQFAAAFPQFLTLYQQRIAGQDMYLRSYFNEYGDYTGQYEHRPSCQPHRSPYSRLSDAQRAKLEQSITVLNRFIADYRAKGAKVLLVYAPLCEVRGDFAQQYEAVIAAQLDAPVLFPIELAHTRLDEHFDTDAHLNWDGVCRRMEVLTTHLDQHLAPRVATTPAEHVANRRRALQTQLAAKAVQLQVR